MAAFGIRTKGPSGQIYLDSSVQYGGIVLEALSITSTGSGSKTYTGPDMLGRTITAIQLGRGGHDWTIDTDGSGYPRITWTKRARVGLPVPTTTLLTVFAK